MMNWFHCIPRFSEFPIPSLCYPLHCIQRRSKQLLSIPFNSIASQAVRIYYIPNHTNSLHTKVFLLHISLHYTLFKCIAFLVIHIRCFSRRLNALQSNTFKYVALQVVVQIHCIRRGSNLLHSTGFRSIAFDSSLHSTLLKFFHCTWSHSNDSIAFIQIMQYHSKIFILFHTIRGCSNFQIAFDTFHIIPLH